MHLFSFLLLLIIKQKNPLEINPLIPASDWGFFCLLSALCPWKNLSSSRNAIRVFGVVDQLFSIVLRGYWLSQSLMEDQRLQLLTTRPLSDREAVLSNRLQIDDLYSRFIKSDEREDGMVYIFDWLQFFVTQLSHVQGMS
ncbi:hypothetical protein HS088_TW04G01033 [Tripterygium wilfordii]|uniref:Uncharacterized protein n=1 Tax=Tripterygium wilfordii TaxID=458696 RepID=A0A7J7DRZ4_TRIWF|nr:hypothetical protein HS088_TW04G01033 [Tripterygium wilfordii]